MAMERMLLYWLEAARDELGGSTVSIGGDRRGYVRCQVTPEKWLTDL
jgi:hypothetical protein